MSLRQWADAKWIHAVPPDGELVRQLVDSAKDDLRQARLDGLGSDWRLKIAYAASLNLATAALMAAGYRADRDQHHYRTLQSLEHTIGLESATVRRFDAFRKKRHVSTYDRMGAVSEQEVKEILALTEDLRTKVQLWLESNHPGLVSPPR